MPKLRARWSELCFHRTFLKALALVMCLALAALLPAQTTSGRILGRVADSTGAIIGNAKVTIINQGTSISRSVLTNDTGDYNFVEVVPGTYTVTFELSGFKKNVQKGVIVDINQVITLNSTLQIGGAQEIVDVTSEAPQVDTTSTQLGAVINDRSVNELPLNSRDTYQFLQLQPGVQAQLGNGNGSLFYGSQDTGSVSVNGGRTRANNFSVNGGDANDQFVNLPTVQPTPDSVEEFRVLTNTFDAEYGRNSGSVVNVITKSGTNRIHGDIYEYFRNTVLDAKNYFDLVGRPQWNQNQFGGTLGGPIIKDHTFFFVDTEGLRFVLPNVYTVTIPSPAFQSAVLTNVGMLQPSEVPLYQKMFGLYNNAPNAASAQPIPNNSDCSALSIPGFNGATQSCAEQFRNSLRKHLDFSQVGLRQKQNRA